MATTKRANPARARVSRINGAAPSAPLVLSSKDDADPFTEREPLFELDGTVYTVPVKVPASYTIRYLDLWAERGIGVAVIYALKTALGEQGYAALTAYTKLTQAQLDQVITAVRGKFDGTDPKSRRS
jgi:hypothetical protein